MIATTAAHDGRVYDRLVVRCSWFHGLAFRCADRSRTVAALKAVTLRVRLPVGERSHGLLGR